VTWPDTSREHLTLDEEKFSETLNNKSIYIRVSAETTSLRML
jgi:hypothetical protein